MSETSRCPYCGSPTGPGRAAGGHADTRAGVLGPLFEEVRRIREIAEARGLAGQGEPTGLPEAAQPRETSAGAGGRWRGWPGSPVAGESRARDADTRRIAELTREVDELRATVARLRGSLGAGMPSTG